MSDAKNGASSRATRPYYFDFSDEPRPTAAHAAACVTAEDLRALFERLDRADESFTADPAGQRKGTLDALDAIGQFLAALPFDGAGRFSRPLKLLHAELRKRPLSSGVRILPDAGGGAGGVDSRPTDDEIRGAAVFTLDFLHNACGLPLGRATEPIAEILDRQRFKFARLGGDKCGAILDWRRLYRSTKYETHPAANAFRRYCAAAPFHPIGDAGADRGAALAWFAGLLARAGYGATA